ncbi:hypothetical protein PLAN_100182 [Planktothrix rubescens CCAP 1459/22]|uniref:Uncharacterized protein n=1 Tax=Planktothrix rubescens CCAP 1459/22 TaxID=329571 RepID=A0A6J7ZFH5_PLARU|nr:hypothetical protein PLAN_100182 [Planktothrix rubescens NIVA-CYA 18]CAD0225923.1 conserved hypothetical protein [Planktothrix agardhii]
MVALVIGNVKSQEIHLTLDQSWKKLYFSRDKITCFWGKYYLNKSKN